MFWRKSGSRTTEKPEQIGSDREARAQLKQRIIAILGTNPDGQFTLRHLEQQLQPVNDLTLSLALAELQAAQVVDRIVRVESPEAGNGGIADFASPGEVPAEIYDWRTQKTIPVEPANISFVFKVHSPLNLEHADVC